MSNPPPPAATPPRGPSWFDQWKWTKPFRDWWANVTFVVSGLGVALTWFLGKDLGPVVAWLCVGFYTLVFFVVVFLRLQGRASKMAENALETSGYKAAEVREPIVRGLRFARYLNLAVTLVLLLVAAVCLVLLLWQPGYHALYTSRPDAIKFSSLHYFGFKEDVQLAQKAPFLEALETFLKDEGQAEGKPTRIIIGETIPFTHPTPALSAALTVNTKDCEITGYAFRLHPGQAVPSYEPVPADYSKAPAVTFAMPNSESGDKPIVSGSIVAEGGEGGKRRELGAACWWNATGCLPKSGASAVQGAVRARPAATQAFVLDLGAHR